MKTKKEIIIETVKFYGDDPKKRSVIRCEVGTLECVYFDDNNNRCAFSKHMLKSKYNAV